MGYPIQLVGLEGRRVLVAGGGRVAADKIAPLFHAGARVHLIAPDVSAEIAPWLPQVWRLERRPVRAEDVEGAKLVVAATDDPAVNRTLAEAARARGILVNVADDPDYCDFYSPAIVRRGPVVMTISTDGGSPLLAAQLRRLLEAAIPRVLSSVADLFVRLRTLGLKGLSRRGQLLRALADPTITRLVDLDRTEEASRKIEALYHEPEEPFEPGTVAIVGAGPGSRQLLTLRALDRIQRADVILHDSLVPEDVLDLALPGTRVVDVGRRCQDRRAARAGGTGNGGREDDDPGRSVSEMRIRLMIREARAGQRVVRLHGGDPFVFGRGGEEVAALEAAGIPWEIVPGVTSVVAAPAAAGVPLTRRGVARGFSVRTGHTAAGRTRGELRPEEETVVVLMGLAGIEEITAGLIQEGRHPDTPAVAVSCATRPNQSVVCATLRDLAMEVHAAGLEAPVTLIVGEVARRALEQGGEVVGSSCGSDHRLERAPVAGSAA